MAPDNSQRQYQQNLQQAVYTQWITEIQEFGPCRAGNLH
jgi:hypothetical protein